MNKLSLHRVFNSMNLFIKVNGKHKEIAKSDCGLVAGGLSAKKRPRVSNSTEVLADNVVKPTKSQKQPHELSTEQCTFVPGGVNPHKRPKAAATEANFVPYELNISTCTLVFGGTAKKRPRAVSEGASFTHIIPTET
ncbi:hypothetical protein [Pseudoalteromonas sp. MMG022]|uniref:hypothetical protein n=1 Tax=Pseudoalteromonas sp. MMG022 TaxID=2909978 RepID=UPI001F241190|nr:hypothetical protein [Pseudoalteromonas sp. MMG022]MCF6437757.1 hypothetical protein [Pseudoalteromonas sp. MMG022]